MVTIIAGQPYVRPCGKIPDEGTEHNEWANTPVAVMYERLTTYLPLAGASMMGRSRPGGQSRLAAWLRDEAPWMANAIDRTADQIATASWAGRPWLALRPMLLVGPPGTGKSHWARRLGELAGTGDAVLSLAGTSGNTELAGNPRGYTMKQPCFPAMTMNRLRTANPVIVVDEVEKATASNNGDAQATLLTMLERSTARRYYDGCLATEIDLSHVIWILTANSTVRLPSALLSRLDVIEVRGPGPEHAEQVITSLWRAVARDLGVPPAMLPPLEQAAEAEFHKLFRKTRSVRRVRRAIEAVVAVSARHAERLVS